MPTTTANKTPEQIAQEIAKKHSTFVRLATGRTKAVLTALRRLKNLTRTAYPYEAQHWAKIEDAIAADSNALFQAVRERSTKASGEQSSGPDFEL